MLHKANSDRSSSTNRTLQNTHRLKAEYYNACAMLSAPNVTGAINGRRALVAHCDDLTPPRLLLCTIHKLDRLLSGQKTKIKPQNIKLGVINNLSKLGRGKSGVGGVWGENCQRKLHASFKEIVLPASSTRQGESIYG